MAEPLGSIRRQVIYVPKTVSLEEGFDSIVIVDRSLVELSVPWNIPQKTPRQIIHYHHSKPKTDEVISNVAPKEPRSPSHEYSIHEPFSDKNRSNILL
jgi:hypothetical protein